MEDATAVVLPLARKEDRPRPIRRHTLGATYSLLIAIAHCLLTILPLASFAAYVPSNVPMPRDDAERHYCEALGLHYMWQRTHPHIAAWCLPHGLQEGNGVQARILSFAADEGSAGWSIFQFVASH